MSALVLTELQAAIAVHKAVESHWASIQRFWPTIGPAPRVLTTTRKSGTAGFAWRSQKDSRVEYNLTYPMTVGMGAFMEILVHELAHIVQFRIYPSAAQGHGPEFRFIMQTLGYAGKTYHSHSVVAAKAASTVAKNTISIAGIL